jgi:hypothetical protein
VVIALFFAVCGAVGAAFLMYGVALVIGLRLRWPARMSIWEQEPAATRRWSGAACVFVAAMVMVTPIALAGSFNSVWLFVQSATIGAAAACLLLGGFLHARGQARSSSRAWIGFGLVVAILCVVAIVVGTADGQTGYELHLFGPYLGAAILAVALGLILHRQSAGPGPKGPPTPDLPTPPFT